MKSAFQQNLLTAVVCSFTTVPKICTETYSVAAQITSIDDVCWWHADNILYLIILCVIYSAVNMNSCTLSWLVCTAVILCQDAVCFICTSDTSILFAIQIKLVINNIIYL